ncbi:MAG: Thioesterase 1/protease 1/lysophospholipase L1 [Candidatus Erwinia impunctatus]|nr:Thioesterase 1/protease 1/lysophospholipase L1 [Culicoides impunctatus]
MIFACSLPLRAAEKTVLILGDSLSAGYRLPVTEAWPHRLDTLWLGNPRVVNASISSDTAAQGLARLPALLRQHRPHWVLIELGANDGLRGFAPAAISADLQKIIDQVKAADAIPLLMQIRLPGNYGRRYTDAFYALYPALAAKNQLTLLPFFMEKVVLKTEWMQDDGLHPTAEAQPFITDFMAKNLAPIVKQ